MAPRVLFVDLHGVLANSSLIQSRYRDLTVDHLKKSFGINHEEAEKRYDESLKKWQVKAYEYLKNPHTPKSGEEFVDYVDRNDKYFVDLLYDGFDVAGIDEENLRTRPYEFQMACKITALYPEVKEVLVELSELGFKMFVASSAFSGHIKGILRGSLIDHLFDGAFGFDTVASTKHTYRFYRRLLKSTKFRASESIMLGNSLQEIIKPRKIGMYTVHINRERRVPEQVQRLADIRSQDLSPIPEKVATLFA